MNSVSGYALLPNGVAAVQASNNISEKAMQARAKGVEMKVSDEQEWAMSPTNIIAEPLNSLSVGGALVGGALNGAGGLPSDTNPQLNWQHQCESNIYIRHRTEYSGTTGTKCAFPSSKAKKIAYSNLCRFDLVSMLFLSLLWQDLRPAFESAHLLERRAPQLMLSLLYRAVAESLHNPSLHCGL